MKIKILSLRNYEYWLNIEGDNLFFADFVAGYTFHSAKLIETMNWLRKRHIDFILEP